MFSYFDIKHWSRKNAFEFYKDFDDPYFNLTVNIDVSHILKRSKEKGNSFFLNCLHVSLITANKIENFRMRIEGKKIRLYEIIHGGSTIFYEDESFGFAYYNYIPDRNEFVKNSEALIQELKLHKSFDPSNQKEDLIYFSSLPWLRFTSIKHANDRRINPSIPRISFGKYFQEGDSILMPVNLEVNHALMDGFHVARFFDLFQEELNI